MGALGGDMKTAGPSPQGQEGKAFYYSDLSKLVLVLVDSSVEFIDTLWNNVLPIAERVSFSQIISEEQVK